MDHVTRDALAARNNNEAQELVEEQGNLGADHLTLQAGVGDFEKKFPVSASREKIIACSTNVIERLWKKKGKKYPAHQIAREKKFLTTRNHPPLPSRGKWSAPLLEVLGLVLGSQSGRELAESRPRVSQQGYYTPSSCPVPSHTTQ